MSGIFSGNEWAAHEEAAKRVLDRIKSALDASAVPRQHQDEMARRIMRELGQSPADLRSWAEFCE